MSILTLPPECSPQEQNISPGISTGSACAPTRSEALLKGLCELIERDAVMIMWRNSLSLPRVEIDSKSKIFDIFHKRFVRPGLEYFVFSTQFELPIPSFMGVVLDTRSGSPSVMVGGAANPDPEKAVLKTLLELVQGLKWKDTMKNQFIPEPEFQNIRSFMDRAQLYATHFIPEAFAFLLDQKPSLKLSEIPNCDLGTPKDNLKYCVEAMKKLDLEILAIDLTPIDAADCGLSVVRVLIPGLEPMEGDHLAPFLGGKRWREVPVRIGLQSNTTSLESRNHYPHPYP